MTSILRHWRGEIASAAGLVTVERSPDSVTYGNTLLSCAVRDDDSRGRKHLEAPDPFRLPFQLDRHRIMSSTAFRRVRSKTQVFTHLGSDHTRTRLTHTLEVAQIARLISVNLRVNESLSEAIALGHDLGHPPFGHAGESALGELMSEHGGFEHNAQSLRVVDHLEHPYPWFRGLNLTFEVREGLARHTSLFDHPDAVFAAEITPPLPFSGLATAEAQVVNVADRLAYDLHDLEDSIGEGMIGSDDLKCYRWWREAVRETGLDNGGYSIHAIRRPVLDAMLQSAVSDLVLHALPALEQLASPDAVRKARAAAVTFSPDMRNRIEETESLLAARVYSHSRVQTADDQAKAMVRDVFLSLVMDPSRLPPRYRCRIEETGVERVVCDYVAGMTDQYCEIQWRNLHGECSA